MVHQPPRSKRLRIKQRFSSFSGRHLPLFKSLGWEIQPWIRNPTGAPLPIWKAMKTAVRMDSTCRARLWPGLEDDPFEQQLEKVHWTEVPSEIKGKLWASIISDVIFGADFPPGFLILVADQEWILVDRFKWPNNRVWGSSGARSWPSR